MFLDIRLDLRTTSLRYYLWNGMTQEVVVTRRGQTTIPIELRRKYRIEEGSKLEFVKGTKERDVSAITLHELYCVELAKRRRDVAELRIQSVQDRSL